MFVDYTVLFFLLISVPQITATFDTHSLQYIITGTTPGTGFPEYVVVGLVDGQQFVYYDTTIKKMIPKTEWMKKNEAEGYWDSETEKQAGALEIFSANLAILTERFNQTKGFHTLQRMSGCELDDDGATRGYFQFGYDGEDFLSLDLNTLTWTAAKPQAVVTKHKWEKASDAHYRKHYLENDCIDYLKKYVGYGRDTLERKIPPEVDLFQKDSSSPVVCHATGFYPKGVMISWKKNGQDLYENVELTQMLPNQDGTFQKRSVLTVSPEDLEKNQFTCVIQHNSLEKELELQVSERRVLSGGGSVHIIIGAVVAVLLLVIVFIVGIFIWRKSHERYLRPEPSDRSEGS